MEVERVLSNSREAQDFEGIGTVVDDNSTGYLELLYT